MNAVSGVVAGWRLASQGHQDTETIKMFNWLRYWVRRHTKPIQRTTAEKWDLRMSLLYGFLTWNAAGYILYLIFTNRSNWPEIYGPNNEKDKRAPSEKFADILGIKKAHVIQISGFRKVGEFDIDRTKENSLEVEKSSKVAENVVTD
ncbi:Putative conserved protein with signal anchor [Gryllus bimaculatus]|nr:Putative conserved protein with signal anchor [Gryllus bimaculatus]